MLFNSLTFVVFFALVLALHYRPFSWRQKKINLLIASYLFYAAWNPPFIILLWISTLVDWHVAKAIFRETRVGRRRGLLVLSIAVNLGILGYFKYGEFLLENWTALMGMFGVSYVPPSWGIILPVGISFYTFQTMAYSLDVYLRRDFGQPSGGGSHTAACSGSHGGDGVFTRGETRRWFVGGGSHGHGATYRSAMPHGAVAASIDFGPAPEVDPRS